MSAEKKKLLIMGVLAFAVLCVGVFQFTGGGKKDAPVEAKPKAAKTIVASRPAAPTDALNNAMGNPPPGTNVIVPGGKNGVNAPITAEGDLPERDPFDGEKYLPADPSTMKAPTTPTPAPAAAKAATRIPPVEPLAMSGSLPTPGSAVNVASLNAKPKDVFEYSVSGVVTGDKPAVVFQDGKGNQRLIQLGGSLDGDTKVLSVSRGKVTVAHHGKNMTLIVGADNPTEKRSDEK